MRGKQEMSIIRTLFTAGVVLTLAACEATAPSIQTGPNAEKSFDGLNLVENSRADIAWAREDFDLSGYTKILLQSTGFEYAKAENRGRTETERNRGGNFVIDENQRSRFEEEVGKVFQDAFAKLENWQVVSEAGPDVMIVRGGLLEVTSFVPPDRVGRSEVFLTRVGEATLILELRDSESNAILARSVDRRAAERMGGALMNSNTVTNASEVRRLARYWADGLVATLNAFKNEVSSN